MRQLILAVIAVISCATWSAAQFGPRIDPESGYRYYNPPPRQFGDRFPYGPFRGNGPPPYVFAPRQCGPPDPYHGWPRYEYFQRRCNGPWCDRP